MKLKLLFFLLATVVLKAYTQENYNAETIPASLKTRANAVIRDMETRIDMRSADNVVYTVNQVITVLNKNGEDRAQLVVFYDKNTSIKSIKGQIFNEFGQQISKFSQSDFADESAVSNFSLFEDSRVKHYLPKSNKYPYTVRYEYEIRFKQNLIIPDWVPNAYRDVAVEKSSYYFTCKPNDKVRIKELNYPGKVEEQSGREQTVYSWKVNMLLAGRPEIYGPDPDSYRTVVKIAPEDFTYYGRKGHYTNWNELGKWIYNDLLNKRQELAPITVSNIKVLIADIDNPKEKARKIYEYMQQKTRYISVQIGIGGFQPMPASEVDQLSYGDCKALVNYTQSLLNVAGIKSYYCVVNAGDHKKSMDSDFASMAQGNHVILCIPFKNDTTWLECTSQKAPFGYLGDFTDDRTVLACTDEGGKLMQTPKLLPDKNCQERIANLVIDKEGSLRGSLNTIYKGSQYDNNQHIIEQPVSEQEKLLKKVYDIDNINFNRISYKQDKGNDPATVESLEIEIRNYCPVNNKRRYLILNAFNKKNTIPDVKNRTLPVYINRGYTDTDSISYILPDNFTIEALPQNQQISSAFGKYETKVLRENNKITYYRFFALNEGLFKAEEYEEFVQFINKINRADQSKIVILSN